ncbi:LytR/AlgR family response regulator transcription factor [Alkalibacter saccharofermentans]|uniref:Stage 0 sporulation protein A homolog n=1 Tax=Alkalibacter saccharofermentans DSM 14828 TaxID=1120975 RepID=A0A1M4ZYL8_9FIRM|nr:LytTR family DNA-binding domain-containing protein [Alkalibacter saccharofermentans]SHF23150.1 two component transcriptional regulator, LytTR family [Alkalibacter saccharofermentans DSM 14828]
MIKIAICDDELHECERVHDFLNAYLRENPRYETTIVTFSAPLELLSHVAERGGFDLYILDVYMAGMLGTKAARELRKLDDKGEIIFLTSSRDHALDAFEVDASQYLIKPYTESAFYSALDKVLRRLKVERRHIITLKTSGGIVRLYSRNIIFTETGRNNYQVIHTIQGEKVEVRMTASELFEMLAQTKNFVRCGVSINLNLKYVRQVKKKEIILDFGEHLAYPYRSYPMLKEKFLQYQMSSGDE